MICGGITFARTEIVGIKTLHEGGSCSTIGLVAVGGHKSPWARSIGQSGPQVLQVDWSTTYLIRFEMGSCC